MTKKVFYTLLGALFFLFAACSEENPSDVSIISSNEESSGSIVVESSSSEDLALYSSSLNAFSSIAETSSSSWEPYSYGKLIDERDGQTYKTIKLGEQTWMAENLNYAYLQPTTTKDSSSECFNNEPDTCAKYGRLYLWSAAMDSAGIFSLDGKGCGKGVNCGSQPSKGVRGVCPENWHIPNEIDKKNFFDNPKVTNNWMVHYWLLAENEDNEYKTEIKSRYKFFWTSEQSANDKVTGLFFLNNILTTAHDNKEIAYPVRCVKDDKTIHIEHGELTDERDGQVYKTVKIGNQWWMAENLNYDDTQNTESINSSCYNNEPDNCAKYGRLYKWRTAMGDSWQTPNFTDYDFKARGICPEKWHVPSFNEWNTLVDFVNNYATDLKSKDGWLDDGNGSDIFGFNALPAGYYTPSGGEWASLGELACFWTTLPWSNLTSFNLHVTSAFSACISSDKKDIFFYYSDDIEDPIWTIGEGLSLRCVKDSEEAE